MNETTKKIYNLKLPKGYLSFSQIDLWIKSKETYRKKYYGGVNFATTPAMAFGNKVTLAMENKEEWVAFIPHFEVFEREFLIDVDGIPVKGAIDNMRPSDNRFREQKTGKTPWSQNKVNKHIQMDIYSLALEIMDGFVNDTCDLIAVKTENVEKEYEFQGHIMKGDSTEIRLTGEYIIRERVITKEDRDNIRKLIVRVGREIEEDFAAYKHLYQDKTVV